MSNWQPPKTNWDTFDPINAADLNRIEGNIGPVFSGWIGLAETWTFSSWSAPVGVINVPSDATLRFSVGMKIRISQTTGGVKHAIITAVTSTTIACNFGSFVLNNEAITAPHFSMLEAPLSFPPPIFTDITQYRRPGRYYSSYLLTGPVDISGTVVANKIFATPFLVTTTQMFDRIAINIHTGAAGDVRLGIYADNGTVYPGNLLFGSVNIATNVTGVREVTITQTLTPGLYWLVCFFSATPVVLSTMDAGYEIDLGLAAPGSQLARGYIATLTYTSLPAVYPVAAPLLQARSAIVFLRLA